MRKHPLLCRLGLLTVLIMGALPAQASDHADPLVLNPLTPPKDKEPRITDLHVFLDKDQNPSLPQATALIVSFCVFPAMPPLEPAKDTDPEAGTVTLPLLPELQLPATRRYKLPQFKLAPYTYRVCLDLHTRLGFANAGDLARYGGTVLDPEDIAPDVTLEFRLNDDATFKPVGSGTRFTGLLPSKTGSIRIRTGVFDDPFIFPRFFRTNIIGMVVSIPLDCFPAGQRNFLIWGTASKKGRQIDHVGRSQRTQLARFDYLNTLPPAQHVTAINRHHTEPGVLWDFGRTFASPLFGRHPYDAAPDVMIFRTNEPTKFPNGRKLSDDVAALIKETGDTQLWEASYTDDPRYPRATVNDGDFEVKDGQRTEVARKLFSSEFPYLAAPWTTDETAKYPRPFALGKPNLADGTWHTLWLVEVAAIGLLVLLLLFTVRSHFVRWLLVALALVAYCRLHYVFAANDPAIMGQAAGKLGRLLCGGGLIAVLAPLWLYLLGRRHGVQSPRPPVLPVGEQGLTLKDRNYAGSRFAEVRAAVFANPYYKVWGGAGEKPLPVYQQSFARVVRGVLRFWKPFGFLQAVRRTLISRADLRWGHDGRGVERLLHPMAACLTGEWQIDAAPEGKTYTGYFKPGSKGLVIARYSTGGSNPLPAKYRSLAMVGKLYPTTDPEHAQLLQPASFVTQEDLGGSLTDSIREAELTNSPPATPWRRGKGIFTLLLTVATFTRAEKQPSERQLYEIAELGKGAGDTVCPRFLRFTLKKDKLPPVVTGLDFRDEILGLIYDPGDPQPRHPLVFIIEVSDEGERSGRFLQRVEGQKWTPIGTLTFKDAVASYNGDYVIHFHHPVWREDRNQPGSVTHPELKL